MENFDAFIESLKTELTSDPGPMVNDPDYDIAPIMESLRVAAETGTPYKEPVTKAVPYAAPKTVPAPSYTPTTTITPAADSPLAKRYLEYSKQPSRVEKEPCDTGGVWVRHFDENGNLFRVFLQPTDDVKDQGY